MEGHAGCDACHTPATVARLEATALPDRAKRTLAHCFRFGRLPAQATDDEDDG